MSLLSDLWYGNLDPQNRTIPRKEEYKQLLTTLCEYEAQFRVSFSPEQQAMIEGYETASISMTAICEEASFVYGIQLGARLMLELLTYESD